jgi:hypothetical protein
MDSYTPEVLRARLGRLERRLWFAEGAWVVTLAALAVGACAGLGSDSEDRLRVRGLIIDDAEGHPRILIGAPVPSVNERRRQDPATGLIVLGPDGVDRLQLGMVGGPQMGGTVQQRQSPATGLMVNDPDGEERGGFGVFENGQVGWGLDYPGREAIVAAVDPASGFAGIVLSADEDVGNPARAMLATSAEGTTFSLSDSAGTERAILGVRGVAPPSLELRDERGQTVRDVLAGG